MGAATGAGAAPSVGPAVALPGVSSRQAPRSARAQRFGGGAHGYPQCMNESPPSAGAMVPGLVTIGTSFVALVVGAVAMVAGYLTFGAVAMIVSLAAATFGAVWLLSGMLLGEHHHSHGRHA